MNFPSTCCKIIRYCGDERPPKILESCSRHHFKLRFAATDMYCMACGVLAHLSYVSTVFNACAMKCQSPDIGDNQVDNVIVPGDLVSVFSVTLRAPRRLSLSVSYTWYA